MKILLVDDDEGIILNNTEYLELKGYEVLKAFNAAQALDLVCLCDCVVLDVNLPDINGFELAPQLKRLKNVPIIFLTAMQTEADIEKGFDLGNDFLRKPYSLKELSLRIAALLKNATDTRESSVSLPPLSIDVIKLNAKIGENELSLTPREYAILMALCEVPNQMLTHEQLFTQLWGSGEVSQHLVRQNVSTLRRKLEEAAPDIRFIKTIHGTGYVLRYPPEVTRK